MSLENHEPDERWRKRARRALESYFEKRTSPRLILTFILAVTGGCGFLVSVGLLHGGVDHMWIRYPVAVLGAYGVFLLLIRLWVEFEKWRFRPETADIARSIEAMESRPLKRSRGRKDAEGSWLDWLDFSSFFDGDEGCALVLLGIALVGVIVAIAASIASASTLTAEVFIDAFLVSVLYRKLQRAARQNWLGTAIRQTILRVFIVAALFAVIGGCFDYLAPGSRSIGPAIQQILNRYS